VPARDDYAIRVADFSCSYSSLGEPDEIIEMLRERLRMEVVGGTPVFTPGTPLFTVSADPESARRFFIRSRQIVVPEKEDWVKFVVPAGIASTLGGKALEKPAEAKTRVPDKFSGLVIEKAETRIIRTDEGEPQQFLFISTNLVIDSAEIAGRIGMAPPVAQPVDRVAHVEQAERLAVAHEHALHEQAELGPCALQQGQGGGDTAEFAVADDHQVGTGPGRLAHALQCALDRGLDVGATVEGLAHQLEQRLQAVLGVEGALDHFARAAEGDQLAAPVLGARDAQRRDRDRLGDLLRRAAHRARGRVQAEGAGAGHRRCARRARLHRVDRAGV